MGAQRKNTVTSVVAHKEVESVKFERHDDQIRWVCSCGAHGRWKTVWLRARLVGKQDTNTHEGTWWSHVLRVHGPEFE